MAAGAISPYINTEIKKATEGNKVANLIAHAVWGAVEAYTQGGKAGTGAVAAVTGEVGANIISKNLFGKESENLTETDCIGTHSGSGWVGEWIIVKWRKFPINSPSKENRARNWEECSGE